MTDSAGEPRTVIGMSPATVAGELEIHGTATMSKRLALSVAANERIELTQGGVVSRSAVSFVPPTAG